MNCMRARGPATEKQRAKGWYVSHPAGRPFSRVCKTEEEALVWAQERTVGMSPERTTKVYAPAAKEPKYVLRWNPEEKAVAFEEKKA